MQKLLETIKIVNGQPQQLLYHNQRLNASRKALFHSHDVINLNDIICNPPQTGIYRCRVIYTTQVESVEYSVYTEKIFKRFKIREIDDISYDFKYLNREIFNKLAVSKEEADDVLIVKQGFVTDTSIANIAVWRENRWLTPENPLLQGTTRARLLDMGKITKAPLTVSSLEKSTKMAIMNALIGFCVLEKFELI